MKLNEADTLDQEVHREYTHVASTSTSADEAVKKNLVSSNEKVDDSPPGGFPKDCSQ